MMSAETKQDIKKDSFANIYRSQLDERLKTMKALALSMGDLVEKNTAAAQELVLGKKDLKTLLPDMEKREGEINDLQIKLFKYCFRSIARQAPVAKDLRMMLTVLSANTDLERMGDLALNIVHRAKDLEKNSLCKNIDEMLDQMFHASLKMVRLSLTAFVEENVEKSKKVLEMDQEVDAHQRKIRDESKKVMKQNADLIPVCVDFIIVSNHLERIADHATNIAEEIIFLQTGMDIRHGG